MFLVLMMALVKCKPDGMIHHSDQGSLVVRIACLWSVLMSNGRVPLDRSRGDADESTVPESFFVSLRAR